MGEPIETAIAAVKQFAAAQGQQDPEPATDTLVARVYSMPLSDLPAALAGAAPLVAAGAKAYVDWLDDEEPVSVRTTGADTWAVVEGEARLRDRLGRTDSPNPWTTGDLRCAAGAGSPQEANARIEFKKAHWRARVSAATGRAAWVGPSVAGFAAWAHTNPGPAIRELLGSKGGAVVSVPDAPSAASSGARLAFAPPAARPRGIAEDPVLEDRLPAGDRAKALPRWRAAQVDVELIDQAAASAIRLVVGWAAAQALAEVHENGALRPARTAATEWSEAQRDAPGAEASAAVASLARWVAADYGETRLRVARAVAAEKLPNPFAVVAAEPVVASADMSYAMAIDETVSQSMQTQRDLERSYLDVEADFAKLRESIAAQADQVVTRALTGALAVAIAALTAKQVRGWPVTIAGGVLALYVGGMAWYTLRPVRNEAKAQFEALRKIVAGRSAHEPAGVEQLETQVNAWRTRINTHAIVAGAVLIALTLAALAGAWLGNEKISPLFPSKEAQKKTMRDRDTTARITPNFWRF